MFRVFNSKFSKKRNVEGLFTKEELINYLCGKVKKKPQKNFLLVNKINENSKNLIGKSENYLMENINLLEEIYISAEELKNSETLNKNNVFSSKNLSNLFLIKLNLIGDFSHYFFNSLNLSSSNLSYFNVSKINFQFSIFTISNFSNCNFYNSNFKSSNFSNAIFENVNFSGCDFSNSDFSNTSFEGSSFKDSKFKKAKFENIKPLSVSRDVLISNDIKLTKASNLDVCELMEITNLSSLRYRDDIKLIEMKINNKKELIGMLKIKSYEVHSFLSFQTILNKEGKVVLMRGFQYSLDSSIYKYLMSKKAEKLFELKELKLMTLRFNQSDRENFRTIYKEILRFLKAYEEGYFNESHSYQPPTSN